MLHFCYSLSCTTVHTTTRSTMNPFHLHLTIFFTGVKITLQISNHRIRMSCHRTQKGEYPQWKISVSPKQNVL